MTIYLVGHMDGNNFVPGKVAELGDGTPVVQEVYVGGGSVREVVGILSGNRVATIELDSVAFKAALKHLWNSEDVEEE